MLSGIAITPSEAIPPDFYAVANWSKARESATPEWHTVLYVNGTYYAHPSVIDKLRENKNENT